MQEPLVNFETAKLAQEKNVNIELDILNNVFDLEDQQPMFNVHRDTILSSPTTYLARPTQSVLQKLLRDNHNIKLFVTTHRQVNAMYSFTILYPPHKGWSLSRDTFSIYVDPKGNAMHEKYEDSLEAGLQKALPLVKSKKTINYDNR